MEKNVLRITNVWGDECFYRMYGGAVQALRQSGAWQDAKGYRTDLQSVVEYFCDGDPEWSYEWVKESDAKYATEG